MLKKLALLLSQPNNPVPDFAFDEQALRTWSQFLGRDSAKLWLKVLESRVAPRASSPSTVYH